jgi:SAM-dependent methyltransferase
LSEAIDYFNRDHLLHRIKEPVAWRARVRMFERFMALARPGPGTRILDVGTTPDLEIAYNNFFERLYPHTTRVTACSVEDCSNLEAAFPGLAFRRIEGRALPAANAEFDVAVSFAVLEHVGSRARQREFIAELTRVAGAFLLYAPYRYFPVEVHTFVPFLHWLPAPWYRAVWRRIGLEFWAEEANLNLMGLRELRPLLPAHGRTRVRLLRTFGVPSNIEVWWTREPCTGD